MCSVLCAVRRWWLSVVRCLLLVGCWLLLRLVCCFFVLVLLLLDDCLLCEVRRALFVVRCVLCVATCVVFVVCRVFVSLSIVRVWLLVVCCFGAN